MMSSFDYADIDEMNDDYASLSSKSNEIDRSSIIVGDILGVGQFGDVFKGLYDEGRGKPLEVAIKTCKLIADEDEMAEKFLKEAYIMEQFDHPHIIQLVGVCSDSPVWIIMEYAPLGEMRGFLRDHKPRLGLDKLTLYCYQISSAMLYLESKNFVHRDIAARNVLVATEDCVKLADFGLSRWVEEENYYKASKGKMPVKWMAPESINYRRFTTSSDVWMFGVCMWEILSYGVKPFQEFENAQVIELLECGERLTPPTGCSASLYSLMSSCWFYKPEERPHFNSIKTRLREILIDEHKNGPSLLNKHRSMPHSTTRMQPDRAPPKPTRPGFSSLTHGLLESGASVGDTGGSGHWQAASSVAAARTEDRLQLQRKQIVEDTAWLHSEESNRLASRPTRFQTDVTAELSYHQASFNDNQVTTRDEKPRLTRKTSSASSPSPMEPEIPIERLESIEINRSNDEVFKSTTSVISSVMDMTNTVNEKNARLYVPLVKNIGESLKVLQASVDALIDSLPHSNTVKMAQKVLNSEMTSLVNAMKLALKYVNTVNLDAKYRREMLQAAHVIAVDSKNLLDTVDTARRVQIYMQQTNDRHSNSTESQYSENIEPEAETSNERSYDPGDIIVGAT